jgi:hypothetical protein
VPLPLVEGAERYATLYLVYAERESTGPGARRLAEIIRHKVAESCRRALAPIAAEDPTASPDA